MQRDLHQQHSKSDKTNLQFPLPQTVLYPLRFICASNFRKVAKTLCRKSKAVIRWVCHPHQPNEGLPTQRNARIRSPLGHPHEPTFFSPSDGESAQVIACADCPSSQSLMFHFLPAFHARPEIFPLGQYEFLLSSMLCLVSATDSV